MTVLIIIFAALILLAGIILVINPDRLFGFLSRHTEKLELQILATVVRLLLGALLIYQSSASRYPLVIEIIGWISIVAGLFFSLIGREKFKRIMTWELTLTKPIGRIGGVIAICFGAFLIHAFV